MPFKTWKRPYVDTLFATAIFGLFGPFLGLKGLKNLRNSVSTGDLQLLSGIPGRLYFCHAPQTFLALPLGTETSPNMVSMPCETWKCPYVDTLFTTAIFGLFSPFSRVKSLDLTCKSSVFREVCGFGWPVWVLIMSERAPNFFSFQEWSQASSYIFLWSYNSEKSPYGGHLEKNLKFPHIIYKLK